VDKDCHVSTTLERHYVEQAIALLSKYGLTVPRIEATRTYHGRHYYFHVTPLVDAQTANDLQYLLGDDAKRVDFNQARINSGLSEWNKLFENVGRQLRTIYRHPSCGRNTSKLQEVN
jgi:murein tripeptide amidase MpaA